MVADPYGSGKSINRTVEPPAADDVELSLQSIRGNPPAAVIRHDLYFLASLPSLVPIAAFVDPRHWSAICRVFARMSPVGRKRRRSLRVGLQAAFAGDASINEAAIDQICTEIEAQRFELDLQVLRGVMQPNWRPDIRIEGADRLDAALAEGRGAILWIGKSAFSDTIAKMALASVGHAPVHLSRRNHGFSHSRLGQRWLNPVQHRFEDRHLAERVILNDAAPSGALRHLKRVLERNGIVSIAVEPWGSHAADVRVLQGRLRIATGALSLAWKTGAKLMPVFVTRESDGSFQVLIDEPLSVRSTQSKQDAQKSGATEYASRLERVLRAAPAEWRDWHRIRSLVVRGLSPIGPIIASLLPI